MEANADRMIQDLHTANNAEPVVESEAAVTPELVQPDDQGVSDAEIIADSSQSNGELDKLREDLNTSEQRYRTLTGMIEARNKENDSLRALVAQLTQSVEQLNLSAQAPAPAAPLVGSADEAAFGSDLIDVMRRVAKETATAELTKMQGKFGADIDKLNQQVNTVAEVTVQSAVDKFEGRLEREVPSWRGINLDPGFTAWLNEYGMLEPLNAAYGSMDLARTAKFFNGYQKFTGADAAQVKPSPAASAADFVAPGKSKATPTPVDTSSGKLWTASDVSRLYEDSRTGKISTEKFATLEADLFKAQAEGRFSHG
jgi:hypothetical protein